LQDITSHYDVLEIAFIVQNYIMSAVLSFAFTTAVAMAPTKIIAGSCPWGSRLVDNPVLTVFNAYIICISVNHFFLFLFCLV